ncbi:MAG: CinA family protein [Candidatus Thioglobus sp.]|nr:CinA family protein [Candidatus Thioglobus sp.]
MKQLREILQQKNLKISVAESCTGGNLSALLTAENGASNYFERGFITYSNQAKIDMLGVNPATLKAFGAVSEQVAMEMVGGVIKHSNSSVGVAITGIAGPTGGSKHKPIGTVCFGFCVLGECFTVTKHFNGSRRKVIQSSIEFTISKLVKQLSNNKL